MEINLDSPADLASQISDGRWLIVADTASPDRLTSRHRSLYWLEFVAAAGERKKSVVFFTLASLLIALAIAMLLPNQYTAVTSLLPPQQSHSMAAAALGQFGDLASLVGRDGLRNPSAIFVSLLQSRSLADRLIARLDLAKVYETKRASQTRTQLEKRTAIESTKDGVIVIQVRDRDPQRAASLANAYVEELTRLNQSLAIGEAAQRRVFFENQVQEARTSLQAAEDQLSATQKATGVVQLDAQAKVYTAAAAELRALISMKELQLDEMHTFATAENPDVVRAEHSIASLRRKLQELETGNASAQPQITTARMASTGLEYLRRVREVKYREAVFEMLAKQLEAARLDEAKNAALIQVLDRAEVPDRKSGPNRVLITLLGGLAGFGAALISTAAQLGLDRWQSDPEIGLRLDQIKRSLLTGVKFS
jgi:tyrosine-protein kinase Etk/Wzc